MRFEIWYWKSDIWYLRSEIWDFRLGLWSLRFEISGLRSEILDLRSEIRNLTSETSALAHQNSIKIIIIPEMFGSGQIDSLASKSPSIVLNIIIPGAVAQWQIYRWFQRDCLIWFYYNSWAFFSLDSSLS